MSDLVQVEKPVADFFVTGNEYMRDNLNLKFIPRVNLCSNDNGGDYLPTPIKI